MKSKSKEKQITEFVIRYFNKDVEEYLVHKGFFAIKKGVYENLNSTKRIEIKTGLKISSFKNGSIYGEEIIEAQLNFIPEIPLLDYILRELNFVK